MKSKGVEEFGLHAFLCSNTVTNEYYPLLAKVLFDVAVQLKNELGVKSALSICPAALAFLTVRSRSRMIF